MISLCALVQMHQKKRRSNNSNSTSMTAGHPDLASVTNTYDSLFGKTDLLASSSLSLSSPLLLTPLPSILLPLPSRGKSARGVCGSLWEIERTRGRESWRKAWPVCSGGAGLRDASEWRVRDPRQRGHPQVLHPFLRGRFRDRAGLGHERRQGLLPYGQTRYLCCRSEGRSLQRRFFSFRLTCILFFCLLVWWFLIFCIFMYVLFCFCFMFSDESFLRGLMFDDMAYHGICNSLHFLLAFQKKTERFCQEVRHLFLYPSPANILCISTKLFCIQNAISRAGHSVSMTVQNLNIKAIY